MNNQKVCLIIMDGWGIGAQDHTNPLFLYKAPFFETLKQQYPYYALQTSGVASGLKFLEEGSSEVGHLILGSGKTIYQTKTRIDQSIQSGDFLTNPVLTSIINHVQTNNSVLHLVGMISSSETMSSLDHLISLIYMARSNGLNNLCIHLIADGKDGPRNEVIDLINKLQKETSTLGAINIGSISGRFYALNEHSELYLDKFYNFLINKQPSITHNLQDHLSDLKNRDIGDEFIESFAVHNSFRSIDVNDGLILFNLKPYSFPFEYLVNKLLTNQAGITNLKIASLVELKKDLGIAIAFPNEKIDQCLSAILSHNQKRQAHLSEALKSLHITYYFNGLNPKPFQNEYWFILPSDPTLNFKENPYLSAPNITERALQIIDENIFDFLLINYPNADMAGHTGDIDIAKTVISILNHEIEKLITYGLKHNYTFIITADHGNIEKMKNPFTGEAEASHNDSFVPIHFVANQWKNSQALNSSEILSHEKTAVGILADISPTVLDIFDIKPPVAMTGHSLLSILKLP